MAGSLLPGTSSARKGRGMDSCRPRVATSLAEEPKCLWIWLKSASETTWSPGRRSGLNGRSSIGLLFESRYTLGLKDDQSLRLGEVGLDRVRLWSQQLLQLRLREGQDRNEASFTAVLGVNLLVGTLLLF